MIKFAKTIPILLLFIVISVASFFWTGTLAEFKYTEIIFEAKSEKDSIVNVYVKTQKGYEKDKYAFYLKGGKIRKRSIFILSEKNVQELSIKTENVNEKIAIGSISVKNGIKKETININKLKKMLVSARKEEAKEKNGKLLLRFSKNNDTWFIKNASNYFKDANFTAKTFIPKILPFIISGVLLLIYILIMLFFDHVYLLWIRKIKPALNNLSSFISEEHLIRFNLKTLAFLSIVLLLFFTLVFFKINGSSFTFYEYDTHQANIRTSLLSGEPREIRKDEWQNTPQRFHPNVFSGISISSILSISPLGYLIGEEVGLAFEWQYYYLITFLGVFLLVLLLSKGNIILSAAGGFWLTFAAHTQWWSAIPLIGSASLTVVSLITFLFAKKKQNVILSAIFFAIFFYQFAMSMYPAWQVPIGYAMMLIVIAFGLSHPEKKDILSNIKLKSIIIALGAIAGIFILYKFYQSNKEYIKLILNTVYPGTRRSSGGGTSLLRIFDGFFNYSMRYELFAEEIYPNICEGAKYMLLFPLPFLLSVYYSIRNKKIYYTEILLGLYTVFLIAWSVWGMPAIISSLSLLSFSTAGRMALPIGFTSAILTLSFVGRKREAKQSKAEVIALTVFTIVLLIGLYAYFNEMRRHSYLYTKALSDKTLYIAYALIFLAILFRRKVLFSILIVFLIYPHVFHVHPINLGGDTIMKKNLIRVMRQIEKDNPKNKRFMMIGDRPMMARFMSGGALDIFNIPYYPNFSELRILDPKSNYIHIYNRYSWAKDVRVSKTHTNYPVFHLSAPDHYTMHIHPESPLIPKIGVDYIVFSEKVSENLVDKLIPLNKTPLNGMYIYKIPKKKE